MSSEASNHAAINLKPYQGLKQFCTEILSHELTEAAINLKPYQGLKQGSKAPLQWPHHHQRRN